MSPQVLCDGCDVPPDRTFFRCLNCGGVDSDQSETHWVCRTCGRTYPVEHGVPILLRDWRQHERDLAQARAVKAGWYLDEQPAEQSSPWRHHLRKRREYVEAALRCHLHGLTRGRAATMLDLGCGDGNHFPYLRPYAEKVFGSDYNLVRLVRARARHPAVTFFLADILDCPARDEFFEAIFLNHVLEHVRDDHGALATVFRLLKPGGLLILGTPNEGAWWWKVAYTLQPKYLRSTDHVHFYTAETLSQKVRASGFTILEVAHLGWGPPHWGLDARIRKYKFVDDAFEWCGRTFLKGQASSLYLLATKTRVDAVA